MEDCLAKDGLRGARSSTLGIALRFLAWRTRQANDAVWRTMAAERQMWVGALQSLAQTSNQNDEAGPWPCRAAADSKTDGRTRPAACRVRDRAKIRKVKKKVRALHCNF